MLAESLFLLSLFGSFAYPHSFESPLVEPITIAYSPSETGTAFFPTSIDFIVIAT